MQATKVNEKRRPGAVAWGLLRSLRPKQWLKNLFVVAPLVFSGRLTEPEAALRAVAAFFLFSALSGAIYLVNDIADIERDRRHPKKRERPLAAGIISVGQASLAAALLGPGALALAFLLSVPFGAVALAYGLLMVAYTKWLKHLVLLDVLVIAIGFVLRVLAGVVVLPVEISVWIVVCTLGVALFLGFTKRRHEMAVAGVNHRPILSEYSQAFLDQLIGISVTMTVITYSLWAVEGPQGPQMLLTLPFVVYGIFRYLYLVYQRGLGGAPEEVILSDWPFLVNLGLWGACVIGVIYFT